MDHAARRGSDGGHGARESLPKRQAVPAPLPTLRLPRCEPYPNLFRCAHGRKALDPERPDHGLDRAIEDKTRDRVGGDRREQDAVAMMAGRVDEPGDWTWPQDRRVVAAAGTVA